ncbi:protein FAR1-RELATED SEQUENCE 5-like isoform X1 [Lolium rigidum]|uniref:protein FAR1-RELATED SEQUENCE 5-like isoform X1 n=2 Tax=Lolium rigidum TaxID=89674 RepID=UPI001F5C51DB|nr:protein FAR1-RELATED SEQUENCE 5-like isoform X1 [Lolium rigidum]
MTGMVAELDKPGADTSNESAKKRGIHIVDGDEGSPVPESVSKKASKNTVKTMMPASELSKEPVGKQSMEEGRPPSADDNYQEDIIEKNTDGLLADEVYKETNSVVHSLQQAEEQNHLHDNVENIEKASNNTSESDSDSSSGGDSDSGLGKYFYPKFEELETARKPEPGMKFQTLEDAHGFYNTYALLNGFVAKRGSNYKRKKYHLDCNRSGKPTLTQDPNKKRKRNAFEKTNCQAKVIVKLTKGQWEFTTVRNEHNHPLCSNPSLTNFFLSHKNMPIEEKSFLKVLQQSRIPPNKVMKIFRRMRSSFGNIPFKKKDATSLQIDEQHRTENSDVQKALKLFKELELRNPCFFYTKQTDKDGIVCSIFWTDTRSRMDYEIFGDFVSVDTTYTTNRHNLPFATIVGINNHGRTLLLGCALLHDRKAETLKWMFQTLLEVMGGKIPGSVVTSQDEAMAKAIVEIMPQVRHMFCKWDVMGKAHERIAAFMAARGNIKAELHSLVDNSLTETEFEEGWISLMQRYNASENEYLQFMWRIRKIWVPVYFRHDFYPFVQSLGCGEGTNLLFKDSVLPKDSIEKFIERYEEIQKKTIQTDDEDRQQAGTVPSCFSLQPIEKHASNIYTRQIFLKVQRELLHSTAFNVQEVQRGAVYRLEKVFNYQNPEFDRKYFEVLVEPGSSAFICQCAKFARDGILCCHIFRLFTQFGINEIPGQYIVPRWTDKFKEEKGKQYRQKCLEKTDSTTRYAMLMSKMADLGKKICGDDAKCNTFMLEFDSIQERLLMSQGECSQQ